MFFIYLSNTKRLFAVPCSNQACFERLDKGASRGGDRACRSGLTIMAATGTVLEERSYRIGREVAWQISSFRFREF
jgi:hypothetical protein